MAENISFSFKINPADRERWELIVELIEQGRTGYPLQDAMEPFGAAVAENLEDYLEDEDYGPVSFAFASADWKGNKLCLTLSMPVDKIERFEQLLRVCPVKNLSVGVPE